ncbi:Asp-tRNA(Asn)/Glu-tRNA(Gln) amidotransferase GatCAB subunit A [Kribbella hippodromi]|uniref:Asp-tRNA(Asn)/Glu-tRNA(Gln) amidotransferase GatCAB subunit A n=1 Tax=Kribbella hippodromi TaxID=434347 RepID=A0ABN2CJ63_9ACTN
MTSSEERVRALWELAGLEPPADEARAIAGDHPKLRTQADALRRAVVEGLDVDGSIPTAFGEPAELGPQPSGPTAPTIQDTAAALRAGTTSAVELTTEVFARISRFGAALGAYVDTYRETALAAAERADRELASGTHLGPLHGIPLAVKDMIATAEGPTRANSLVPPPGWTYEGDAAVVARLRQAGAIIVGKATTSEYAVGPYDPTKGFLRPRNAWDPERFAGSSSSGTAVAVAAGLALGGLGTDSGGSIRHPAALNGVTGLKPTYGQVSTAGVVPLAPTLDTVGPIARSAWDCAVLLQAMTGDAGVLTALDGSARDLRIGVPKRYFFDSANVSGPVKAAVEAAISVLSAAGATVTEVDLPNADMAKMANHIVLLSEGFAHHQRSLIDHWPEYGKPLRALFARGATFTAADYVNARRMAGVFGEVAAYALRDCDVLITPTLPTGAARLDETDPTGMHGWASAMFTPQWNLTGLPSCAVPIGFDHNHMPLSMQLIAPHHAEPTLLRTADAYQQLTSFHLLTPPERPATVSS